jgi:hypothetical protein
LHFESTVFVLIDLMIDRISGMIAMNRYKRLDYCFRRINDVALQCARRDLEQAFRP